jgi:hypothetical protein
VPFHQRKELFDQWDQDHAMFLGLGTPSGLWQSVIMKPPNMKSVYPVAPIKTIDGFQDKISGGPFVILNAEAERRDDLLFN